jgi:phospholipid/cholesterol/gamma-HCH transport system substrate-binding protein
VQFKQISEDLSRTLHSFQRLADRYSGSQTASEVSQTMESLRRVSGRLDSVLATAKLEKSLRTADSLMGTLAELSNKVKVTGHQIDSLLTKLRNGEGTLGKFVTDTMLYHNLQVAIKSAQEFIDDLRKHPGKIGITLRVF